ncbi:hypothetical protein SAMN05661096_01310 [Marivirga sericea]|jgi:hypothetical protein|nr:MULTISPECIES: hypothetical protein [Marivirga]SMG22858.1 hypothetical protein SAMN05661096_01310 [Marivirga sericea]
MEESKTIKAKSLLTWMALIAFVLNFIWENLHAGLYNEYNLFMKSIYFLGCTIGDVVLTFIIYGLVAVVLKDKYWIRNFNFKILLIVLIMASLVSLTAEWVAVELDFWSYNERMPVVPFLDIGLSPFLAIIVNPILSFICARKIVFS